MVKQADYQMYIEEDGRGITKTNMLKQVPVPPHGGKMHLTVSYTHLDVYKRQLERLELILLANITKIPNLSNLNKLTEVYIDTLNTVSYTHLKCYYLSYMLALIACSFSFILIELTKDKIEYFANNAG